MDASELFEGLDRQDLVRIAAQWVGGQVWHGYPAQAGRRPVTLVRATVDSDGLRRALIQFGRLSAADFIRETPQSLHRDTEAAIRAAIPNYDSIIPARQTRAEDHNRMVIANYS